MSELFYASLVEGLSKGPTNRYAHTINTTNVVFPSYYILSLNITWCGFVKIKVVQHHYGHYGFNMFVISFMSFVVSHSQCDLRNRLSAARESNKRMIPPAVWSQDERRNRSLASFWDAQLILLNILMHFADSDCFQNFCELKTYPRNKRIDCTIWIFGARPTKKHI